MKKCLANTLNEDRISWSEKVDPSSLGIPRGAAEGATGVYLDVHEDCERRPQQSGKPKCDGYIKASWNGAGGAAQKMELISKYFALATAFLFPLSTTLQDFALLLAIAFNLLAGGLKQKFRMIIHNPISLFFLLFFAFYVVGVLYTLAPLDYALLRLAKYDKFLWGALLFPVFCGDDKWRNYAIRAFLISIAIVLTVSYLKFFGILHIDVLRGPAEVFKDHIAFTFLLNFAAYLVLLEVVRAKSTLRKILLIIYFLLIVYDSVFMCISRTGYFVLIGLLFLFFIQRLHWKGVIVACVAIFILVGGAMHFSPIFKSRIEQGLADMQIYNKNRNTSLGLRRAFVEGGLKEIRKHLLIGTGTGSILQIYSKKESRPVVVSDNPHNEYIAVAMQLGLIGFGYLIFMFIAQLCYSRYLMFPFNNIAQGMVLTIIIGSLANSWLTDSTQLQFYVFMIALTFSGLIKRKIRE